MSELYRDGEGRVGRDSVLGTNSLLVTSYCN